MFGDKTLPLITELDRRIKEETKEAKTLYYLLQCLSVALQHGNAAAVTEYLVPRITQTTFISALMSLFFVVRQK